MSKRELKVGDSASVTRTVVESDIIKFGFATGDDNPVHFNDDYAARTRFGKRIAHGMLSAGFISAALGTKLPGPGTIYLEQSLKFKGPVFIGDTITATVKVTAIDTATGIITLETVLTNESGRKVVVGEARVIYEPVED
jgi:3-hydroxybutyryl-CoA dehydratase